MIGEAKFLNAIFFAYLASLNNDPHNFRCDWTPGTHPQTGLFEEIHEKSIRIVKLKANHPTCLPEFDGGEFIFGVVIEYYSLDESVPLNEEDNETNYGKPNPITARPKVITQLVITKKYHKLTTYYNDPIVRCLNNPQQLSSYFAAKVASFYSTIIIEKRSYKLTLVHLYIQEIWDLFKNNNNIAPAFDKAQNWDVTRKVTINGKEVEKLTFVSTGTGDDKKIAAVWRKYTANSATSWDDAVAKGYLVEKELWAIIKAPTRALTDDPDLPEIVSKFSLKMQDLIDDGRTTFATHARTILSNLTDATAFEGTKLYLDKGIMARVSHVQVAGLYNPQAIAWWKQKPPQDFDFKEFKVDSRIYGFLIEPHGIQLRRCFHHIGTDKFEEMLRENLLYRDHYMGQLRPDVVAMILIQPEEEELTRRLRELNSESLEAENEKLNEEIKLYKNKIKLLNKQTKSLIEQNKILTESLSGKKTEPEYKTEQEVD